MVAHRTQHSGWTFASGVMPSQLRLDSILLVALTPAHRTGLPPPVHPNEPAGGVDVEAGRLPDAFSNHCFVVLLLLRRSHLLEDVCLIDVHRPVLALALTLS